eukprot:3554298-Alexandrium_andersonii.AAC.1
MRPAGTEQCRGLLPPPGLLRGGGPNQQCLQCAACRTPHAFCRPSTVRLYLSTATVNRPHASPA